jgi:hypothetical protein
MAQLLPCPLCGHLNDQRTTRTRFKCRGCEAWLEMSKDFSHLQDHDARKLADKARVKSF